MICAKRLKGSRLRREKRGLFTARFQFITPVRCLVTVDGKLCVQAEGVKHNKYSRRV